MTTGVVPENVAVSVEGCWDLGQSYRIVLRRTDSGLRADTEADTRLGKRVVRDEPVQYDPHEQTLGFAGVGAIHRTLVVLRPSGSDLKFALSSEISSGKWTQTAWEKARRCTPDQAK
jgi:hypothetical protein